MNKGSIKEYEFKLALRIIASNMRRYEVGRMTGEEYKLRSLHPLRIIKLYRSQEGCSGFPLDNQT